MGQRLFRAVPLLLVVLCLLTLPFAGNAQAQSTSADKLGLTVSPVIDEFSLPPGKTVARSIKITNPVHDTVTLYPVTLNFTTDNDQGQPTFYSLKDHSSPFAISDWISFPKPSITINAGETQEFDYNIIVPSSAEPGGHYGAVLFSTQPPQFDTSTNQVSVVGLIGVLLLATVPGDLVQRLNIDDFTAPTFLMQPPANFSLTFNNLGNVHLKPFGDIKIRNMFGKVVTILHVNDSKANILPESKRKFDQSWKFSWKQVGKYTATAVIGYGTPEQQLIEVRTFYIIPLWLIVLIGLAIIALIFWRIRRRRQPATFVNTIPSPPSERPRRVMG